MVALALVAATASAVWYETGNLSAVLVVAVGATAATLFALTMRPIELPRPATPAAGPAASAAVAGALDVIAEPLVLIAREHVIHANPSARVLLGDHILGENIRVAIRHPAAAERLARGGSSDAVPIVGLGTRDQHWEMRVAALGDDDGASRLVHFVDRSGVQAAERMRVDFVANASHELRTPLASLLGFIETLGDEAGEEPATRKRFLELMDAEARRMQRLVDDLISLSRIEAVKFRIPDQPVDLAELVREVCNEITAGQGERGRDLSVTLAELPPILADRAQISQLLHNLVGNAMKYGRPGTPVTIVLAPAPAAAAMVALTVTDRGEGIAPEHIPRLTERFYRVDMGRSRSMGGTGLGLAIVKHIVERHRGRLDIASVPGSGSTVTVLLPAGAVIKP